MQTLGDARAHFWRVIKMAKACEVDLSTALDEDKINIAQYADMITGCQGCTQVARCDRLLAEAAQVDQAPDYCVNRATFGLLRGG
ncbi:DUF6455 family protein [Roseobacter sp. CCS2]|uniref:DUF6455 family protein n=1 Tax=Roseobacter sp. CCS2 TaxID=391593 RepID=UPI0000F4049A|nr:DUF6455 family protein [Roseobacter sp. CCS2]EBA13029.1 hypothetical protein RCCS2_04069 [Roseobacter sp. CCS2]